MHMLNRCLFERTVPDLSCLSGNELVSDGDRIHIVYVYRHETRTDSLYTDICYTLLDCITNTENELSLIIL